MLFIGTQFLYTSMYSPAEAATQAAGSLWQSSVHHRLGPNHADHERIKKARLKTVETSSAAAGGKKKPLRFHSATSERFGKMLRALKTGTRRSGDGLDKMRLHSKMLRAWMVTLLAFRKKMYTKS